MFRKTMFVLMVLIFLMLPTMAVAQNATAEPVEAAPVEQPQIVVQQPEANNQIDLVLAIAMATLPLLGVLVGGGGVFVFIQIASENKPLKDSTEKLLFDSTPPATIKLLHQLAQGGRYVSDFISDVTDGKPNGLVTGKEYELPPGVDPAEFQKVMDETARLYISRFAGELGKALDQST